MVQKVIMIIILILVLSNHLVNSSNRNAFSIQPFNIAYKLMEGTGVVAMALAKYLQLQCGSSVAMWKNYN